MGPLVGKMPLPENDLITGNFYSMCDQEYADLNNGGVRMDLRIVTTQLKMLWWDQAGNVWRELGTNTEARVRKFKSTPSVDCTVWWDFKEDGGEG